MEMIAIIVIFLSFVSINFVSEGEITHLPTVISGKDERNGCIASVNGETDNG
jgi:hypothetical protein